MLPFYGRLDDHGYDLRDEVRVLFFLHCFASKVDGNDARGLLVHQQPH